MSPGHHKHIRLPDWDYSQPVMYMVTICIADRSHRLGTILETTDRELNNAGRMVEQELLALANNHHQITLDEYVIMPNHIHFLIGLNFALDEPNPLHLGEVVGELKSRTTNRYITGVRRGLLPPFNKRLWQIEYYETIMRNRRMIEERRAYIRNNPANWRTDPEMN